MVHSMDIIIMDLDYYYIILLLLLIIFLEKDKNPWLSRMVLNSKIFHNRGTPEPHNIEVLRSLLLA